MLYQGDNAKLRTYSIVMVAFGASLFGLPAVVELLPDLFRWHEPAVNLADERMIVSMYYALGICFIVGAKDPVGNAIIIDYAIISSVLHGLVMTYYALTLETEMAHLWGDIPFLFAIAIFFAVYNPRKVARSNA
jgi:hypothetical protein